MISPTKRLISYAVLGTMLMVSCQQSQAFNWKTGLKIAGGIGLIYLLLKLGSADSEVNSPAPIQQIEQPQPPIINKPYQVELAIITNIPDQNVTNFTIKVLEDLDKQVQASKTNSFEAYLNQLQKDFLLDENLGFLYSFMTYHKSYFEFAAIMRSIDIKSISGKQLAELQSIRDLLGGHIKLIKRYQNSNLFEQAKSAFMCVQSECESKAGTH